MCWRGKEEVLLHECRIPITVNVIIRQALYLTSQLGAWKKTNSMCRIGKPPFQPVVWLYVSIRHVSLRLKNTLQKLRSKRQLIQGALITWYRYQRYTEYNVSRTIQVLFNVRILPITIDPVQDRCTPFQPQGSKELQLLLGQIRLTAVNLSNRLPTAVVLAEPAEEQV